MEKAFFLHEFLYMMAISIGSDVLRKIQGDEITVLLSMVLSCHDCCSTLFFHVRLGRRFRIQDSFAGVVQVL